MPSNWVYVNRFILRLLHTIWLSTPGHNLFQEENRPSLLIIMQEYELEKNIPERIH